MDLEAFRQQATDQKKENKKFIQKLKRLQPKNLDQQVSNLHDEVFEELDCLSCANCCKTTSPIFIPKDIDRLAKSLRIRPVSFIDQYLTMDNDGDYVLKSSPCPFLDEDNYCKVYESRPRACREYPHTNRKKFHQILNLTYKNTMVCPATLKIVNRLKKIF